MGSYSTAPGLVSWIFTSAGTGRVEFVNLSLRSLNKIIPGAKESAKTSPIILAHVT